MDQIKPLNIILLEDVATDAALVERQLKKAGIDFTMQRVTNKDDYIAALNNKPDVILSDYALPHFSGLEAFMILQQKGMVVPFLLVTGALPEATVIEIIKAGIDDYILKGNLQRLPNALQNAYAKRKAERRSEQLNELRAKFVNIMAHQMRTPLTVVKWNLEHLLGGEAGTIKPAQESILREAYNANQDMSSRIDDLLTVIEIEEGRTHIAKQATSLTSLWKSVMVSWLKACKVKDVTCTYDPIPDALSAVVDPEKIRKAMAKLTDNALAYTPPKGIIHVRLQKHDNAIRFEVTDSGVGIPKTEQHNIFTAFFRASNASVMQQDASGVSLAIIKYYVEQHNGTLGFTSNENKGSTFWFEVPAAP